MNQLTAKALVCVVVVMFSPQGAFGDTGTFGGGTATLQASPDGGTTWVDVLDQASTAITFTANKAVNVEVASDGLQPVRLSINLTGSTSPNLSFVIFDGS